MVLENNLIKKGYSEDLVVEHDDDDMLNISKIFINILEENYKYFIEKLEENEEKLKKYLNNKNYVFTPENIVKKSPLTIINSPWGVGKTYFIESLIKNFIDKKVESDLFKNLIIIDCWKFSDEENISKEILSEIIIKLLYVNPKYKHKKELKIFLINTFNTIFNSIFLSITNNFLKTNFKEIELKDSDFNTTSKIEFNPTIIFLDNLERLSNDAWQVLKVIYKLQQIKGLILILLMNMKFLNNPINFGNSEYPIEKFIDIKYFEFKQNYLSLLINMGFEKIDIEDINKILEEQIKGENLTVREVKQRLQSNNIISIKNRYEKYKV